MPCKVYKHAAKMQDIIKRAYNRSINNAKKWCEKNNCKLIPYSEAHTDDICIISQSDYDLLEQRQNITEDNISFFLSAEDYEKWTGTDE